MSFLFSKPGHIMSGMSCLLLYGQDCSLSGEEHMYMLTPLFSPTAGMLCSGGIEV